VQRLRPRLVLVAAALCAASVAGASGPAPAVATTTASATALRITVPGAAPAGTATATSPPDSVAFGGPFTYGPDGTAVTAASVDASALTSRGSRETATASADVTSLSLFGGEITAAKVSARAAAKAGATSATGGNGDSAVSKLVVLGQPVSAAPGAQVALADWGTLTLLAQAAGPVPAAGARAYRATAAGLDITLTAAHAGLPAGTRIVVSDVTAAARAPARPATPPPASPPPPAPPPSAVPPPAPPAPGTAPAGARNHPRTPARTKPLPASKRRERRWKSRAQGKGHGKPSTHRRRHRLAIPLRVTPPLGPGDYVFPVFGEVSWGDTFGAPRADVSYHHGDDLFARRGAPVLAVADGTVFSVGFIPIGGNRLWLRDGNGNQFYYAHLSAYSPLGVNGARVHAGDVLGFVGDTGDARGTPFHLHFEVHPRQYLGLGYDGAVDPTSYLAEWRRLTVLPPGAAAFPRVFPRASSGRLPVPGAILLHVADISSADGLDPGSLRTALAPSLSGLVEGATPGVQPEAHGGRPTAVPLQRG
jgi:murein DD-endopeptidase MepM/ murein hydrolase activator NlpD